MRIRHAISLLAIVSGPLGAQSSSADADREAVKRAVLDYVEGFYEGDSTKLVRSIRPQVYKYGFWWARDSSKYLGEQMTWDEILAYARRVKRSGRVAPATAPKVVQVFEVQNETASAKVTAFWGTDYLLVGKYGERWMISHVLWQSPPPKM
jgi:hypothetical protein